jgi:hypothetical protein
LESSLNYVLGEPIPHSESLLSFAVLKHLLPPSPLLACQNYLAPTLPGKILLGFSLGASQNHLEGLPSPPWGSTLSKAGLEPVLCIFKDLEEILVLQVLRDLSESLT